MVKSVTIETFEPFLTKPGERLHLNAIAREIQKPHTTIRLHLNSLGNFA